MRVFALVVGVGMVVWWAIGIYVIGVALPASEGVDLLRALQALSPVGLAYFFAALVVWAGLCMLGLFSLVRMTNSTSGFVSVVMLVGVVLLAAGATSVFLLLGPTSFVRSGIGRALGQGDGDDVSAEAQRWYGEAAVYVGGLGLALTAISVISRAILRRLRD